jgi:hypothetical protein
VAQKEKVGYLFNIKTGELLRLNACMEDLNMIVSEILRDKYKYTCPKTDEEFLHMVDACKSCFDSTIVTDPVSTDPASDTETDTTTEA